MTFGRACLGLLLASVSVGCHPADWPNKFHVVSVQGTGDFEAKPDIAHITLGCESQAATAVEATQATATKVAAIVLAIEQSGVLPKDLQTSQLSIYSEQVTPPPGPTPPVPVMPTPGTKKSAAVAVAAAAPAGPELPQFFYRATNTVNVTIRQIDRAGTIIGAAIAAGANQASGIQFDVENHQPLEDQARAKAVLDAQHRASELARLSSVKLGRVVRILEGGATDGGPQPMFAKAASFRSDSGVAPVEGGQIKVTYTVQLVYSLGE